jgi:hypothetical protein
VEPYSAAHAAYFSAYRRAEGLLEASAACTSALVMHPSSVAVAVPPATTRSHLTGNFPAGLMTMVSCSDTTLRQYTEVGEDVVLSPQTHTHTHTEGMQGGEPHVRPGACCPGRPPAAS